MDDSVGHITFHQQSYSGTGKRSDCVFSPMCERRTFFCCSCVVATYVWMSVSQQLVEDVAELPAEHRIAGERKPVDRRPESVGAFLMMGPQDAG